MTGPERSASSAESSSGVTGPYCTAHLDRLVGEIAPTTSSINANAELERRQRPTACENVSVVSHVWICGEDSHVQSNCRPSAHDRRGKGKMYKYNNETKTYS